MDHVRGLIKTFKSDQLAILLSALCMVHCLGLPALVAFAPSLGDAHASYTHLIFFVLVAGLAGYSFVKGYRVHKQQLPAQLGSVGILLILLAIFAPHGHINIFTYENVLTAIGGIILIYAHILNIKGCHCSCCQ